MKRLMLFTLAVVFSLVLAAAMPGSVYAEGDIPEAPPEPPVIEETPPENTGSVVEQLAESGAVIADAGGDLVPLASQAALEAVCDPDPWFYGACPGGKCTGYTTINQALSAWAGKKGYGFIYLEGNYNINQSVLIDGSITGMGTLKGIVWDKKTAGARPHVNGLMEIHHFPAGFTLQGFTKTASASYGIYFHNNSGLVKLVDLTVSNPGGTGILISTQKGPVSITSVTASDSLLEGLSVNNAYWDGAKYINSGNVTITNSAFLRNGGPANGGNNPGLTVTSSGSILLNGVTASGNAGDGGDFYIYGVLPLTIRNSVFSYNIDNPETENWGYGIYTYVYYSNSPVAIILDNVTLIGNGYDGAILRTGGNITLNKVYAASNDRFGVYISGTYETDSVGAKSVTVTNSTFIGNTSANLEIHASGAVKVVNLYSTGSSSDGLYVVNTYGTLPASVTIQGAVVTGNASRGLYARSKGAITLTGITNLDNGLSALVTNSSVEATAGIVVSGALGLNRFNRTSGGNGLIVETNGNAALSSIQANDNLSYGIHVIGHGITSNVTLINIEVSGNRGVGFQGISIETTGAVTLSKVSALNNAGEGIYVDNTTALYSRPVKISSSVALHNGYTGATDNNKDGIYIKSAGAITLSGVSASGNSNDGANLDNFTLTNPATQVYQGITVIKSTFENNNGYGVDIITRRKISLSSINASANTYTGVYADNATSEISSAIVVTGTNRFYHNGIVNTSSGIYLNSVGLVSLSGITSFGNGYHGISIMTALGVTVSNVVLVNNGYNGIQVSTSGPVTMGGVTALNNGIVTNSSGVWIISTTGSRVVLTSGLILGNGAYGVQINVANPTTDAYVAPGVVVFGNDVNNTVGGLQILIY